MKNKINELLSLCVDCGIKEINIKYSEDIINNIQHWMENEFKTSCTIGYKGDTNVALSLTYRGITLNVLKQDNHGK